jgi:hypothetical protein
MVVHSFFVSGGDQQTRAVLLTSGTLLRRRPAAVRASLREGVRREARPRPRTFPHRRLPRWLRWRVRCRGHARHGRRSSSERAKGRRCCRSPRAALLAQTRALSGRRGTPRPKRCTAGLPAKREPRATEPAAVRVVALSSHLVRGLRDDHLAAVDRSCDAVGPAAARRLVLWTQTGGVGIGAVGPLHGKPVMSELVHHAGYVSATMLSIGRSRSHRLIQAELGLRDAR